MDRGRTGTGRDPVTKGVKNWSALKTRKEKGKRGENLRGKGRRKVLPTKASAATLTCALSQLHSICRGEKGRGGVVEVGGSRRKEPEQTRREQLMGSEDRWNPRALPWAPRPQSAS